MDDLLTRGINNNGELRPSYEEAPNLYRETSLGWIPKEWKVLKIRDARKSITSGSRWWARNYADEGALFLRIGNLTREHINLRFDSIQRVRVPNNAESKRTAVAAGDVLISVTADLGIIGVIPENFEEAYVNQHIALIKVDPEITNSRWLGHFMASRLGWQQFQTLNDGGAKAGLNLPTVDSLSFANPLKEERNRIVMIIDNHDDMIRVEKEQVAKLQLFKQGLMQDLLSGQVRVKV
jgi:type I restriction enzyme S subunit